MSSMKEDHSRTREWEVTLPSPAELTPLSHSLISRVLAKAFCISVSTLPTPTASDVVQASQSTLQLLQQKNPPSFPFTIDPYPSHESPGGGAFGAEDGLDDGRGGYDSLKTNKDDSGRRGVRTTNRPQIPNKGAWENEKRQDRDVGGSAGGVGRVGNGNSAPEYGQTFYWTAQGVMQGAAGHYGSFGLDQGGLGGMEAVSENNKVSSLDKSKKLTDTESEDVDSADGPDGNTARTLKRPRLVWTPQLHKRFVDAVGHLGIKNAVPKTIMQLMNVEGLTRENVASHLQKYRLYLKRMQGLSNEGPSASDPLFSSTPLPPNLTSAHFFPGHQPTRVDAGVPGTSFSPPTVQQPRPQGTLLPGTMGPGAMGRGSVQHFTGFEHHPYAMALSRTAPQRPPNLGDHRDILVNAHSKQPGSGSPPQRILTLFPPGGNG